jgi:hypothetical protein
MVWLLALAVCALFAAFFWHVAVELFGTGRRLISMIQNWPQTRRALVDAEARSGGRYPFWFRAVRVFLVLATIGLAALLVWRKLGNFN